MVARWASCGSGALAIRRDLAESAVGKRVGVRVRHGASGEMVAHTIQAVWGVGMRNGVLCCAGRVRVQLYTRAGTATRTGAIIRLACCAQKNMQ